MLGLVQPVSADDHLPIVDIVPTTSFTTTGNAETPPGGSPETNGATEINGTATIPILKGLSASYDRISLGAFDSNLQAVIIGGKTVLPGGSRDLIQQYRLDYHQGHFNLEGGFESRYRRCCPADSFEWHKGYVGLSYSTPPLVFLNHGIFVLDITGNANHQHASALSLASNPVGLPLKDGEVYTTTQAVTAVIPVSPKIGIRTAATFIWGANDWGENSPFPSYYDIWVFAATKQITDDLGFTINTAQVTQRIQGSPFPPPNVIKTSALNMALDFHVDFNKIFAAPPAAPPGRSTEPGTPGGPGGPAPLGPTQGGTVSPSPSPAPMAPAAPAPAPAGPAPTPSATP